jgi:type I restriction enzyme M protein
MPNERKTETLVRETLRVHGYFEDEAITVDEQRSDNPRIKKLLAMASKGGRGGGQPEFIISSSRHPDFLIVIECKGDPGKHESLTHDKFAEYAVDGALLYASYLSREYDVLAIGVSGQTRKNSRSPIIFTSRMRTVLMRYLPTSFFHILTIMQGT